MLQRVELKSRNSVLNDIFLVIENLWNIMYIWLIQAQKQVFIKLFWRLFKNLFLTFNGSHLIAYLSYDPWHPSMLMRHVRLSLVLRGCKQGCWITMFTIETKVFHRFIASLVTCIYNVWPWGWMSKMITVIFNSGWKLP